MNSIQYTLGLNTGGFVGPLQTARAAVGSFQSGMTSLVAKAALIAAPLLGAASAAGLMAESISKAARMETLTTAFIPLLGSVDAAKDRMADLAKFAEDTPFELPEVAAASRTLETLTQGALSTSTGLRLVGDVASGTGSRFEDVAVTVGRLYDGLQSGRPVGEASQRLQELGVISGSTRGKLEDMQAEGLKGEAVWNIAAEALGRFSGSMELQSKTWTGKLSNLTDGIGQAFVAFGTPIMDSIKPFLDKTISATASMAEKAKQFGQAVGSAISMIAAAWSSGELGDLAENSLKMAMLGSVNVLFAGMIGTFEASGQLLIEGAKNFILYFQILTTADFWKGMGNALVGVFLGAISFLQRGMANALEVLRPMADLFDKGFVLDAAQAEIRDTAKDLSAEAATRFVAAADQLAPITDKIAARAAEEAESIKSKFLEGYNKTGNVFDTEGIKKAIADSILHIRYEIDRNQAQKSKDQPAPGAGPATKATDEESREQRLKRVATDNAKAKWDLENQILDAKIAGNNKLVKQLERQAAVEATKLTLMKEQKLTAEQAAAAAERHQQLQEALVKRQAHPNRTHAPLPPKDRSDPWATPGLDAQRNHMSTVSSPRLDKLASDNATATSARSARLAGIQAAAKAAGGFDANTTKTSKDRTAEISGKLDMLKSISGQLENVGIA